MNDTNDQTTKPSDDRLPWRGIAIGSGLLLAVLVAAPLIQKEIDTWELSGQETAEPKRVRSVNPILSKSGSIRLDGGTDFVGAGISEAVYDRYQQLYEAEDDLGKSKMYEGGLMIKLTNGTTLTIIDHGFSKTEVRVTSGLYTGTACWVPTEAIAFR